MATLKLSRLPSIRLTMSHARQDGRYNEIAWLHANNRLARTARYRERSALFGTDSWEPGQAWVAEHGRTNWIPLY